MREHRHRAGLAVRCPAPYICIHGNSSSNGRAARGAEGPQGVPGQRSREQVLAATLAVLVTIIIIIIFLVDSKINTAPPPQIVYVENYGPDRTDADIIADQKKASEERHKAEEARRKEFQKLEKQFGIE